jgi:hypothetical protein
VTLLQTSPVSYSGRGGSAREYVDTDFSPVDGARPYVKPTYQSRNGWAEIKGYLERDELPKDVPINLALAIDLAPAGAASGPVDRPQLERAHETVAYRARELNVRNPFRSALAESVSKLSVPRTQVGMVATGQSILRSQKKASA